MIAIMVKLVVVYHSGFGHTKRVAEHVASGASSVTGTQVTLLAVDEVADDYSIFDEADGIIFGCPTYMGGPSAEFKKFLDSVSKVWLDQKWKDKIAAGFTNSWGLSGDKLNTLSSLWINAMQHSMIWVSVGLDTKAMGPDDVNRLASYSGLMTQSDNVSPDLSPPLGDLKTAELFGIRVAQATHRWVRGRSG
jgi:NAD(P)H dehydrogenase (quinone)